MLDDILSTYAPRPFIVITGPTASGKTSLAIELAERYSGEIICADSRTVYRDMDIGSAKPSHEDRSRVPHHLLDIAHADVVYTAADFKRDALAAIRDIYERGKIPFIVGGSGLYIDGLLLDYRFGPRAHESLRKQQENVSIDDLKVMLKNQHIEIPQNHNNRRYLVRALEQGGVNKQRSNVLSDQIVVVAIATDKQKLEARIRARADEIFAAPIIEEAKTLALRYGWEHESMSGNIYPIIKRLIDGELSLLDAKELFVIKDRQLAKKQITWLKRREYVQWRSLNDARVYLSEILERS